MAIEPITGSFSLGQVLGRKLPSAFKPGWDEWCGKIAHPSDESIDVEAHAAETRTWRRWEGKLVFTSTEPSSAVAPLEVPTSKVELLEIVGAALEARQAIGRPRLPSETAGGRSLAVGPPQAGVGRLVEPDGAATAAAARLVLPEPRSCDADPLPPPEATR